MGDVLQCGYHGLSFDPTGTCVWAPGQDRVPSRANLTTRPLVEDGAWIWVWMGDAEAPDHGRRPRTPWFTIDGWAEVHGMEPLDAHYGLLIDNLLDLSHETFLHAGFIGTPEVAETPIVTEVDEASSVVHVSRHMSAVECPPFYAKSTGLDSPIDRWQDIEYHPPGYYLLHSRIAPAGVAPGPNGEDDGACHLKVLYAITPIDETHTLDFWAVCRDFAADDGGVDQFLAAMNRTVVLQDVEALNAMQVRFESDHDESEVSFKIDTGGLAARRILTKLATQSAGTS
jgi:vanillate O-demethylase monooxygenase subunit